MAEDHDVELVTRVRHGDRDALEVLYRRHAPWITTRLQHRCQDDDLVDLAVQDTFVALWRHAGSYQGRGEVPAWLWGIAVRKLMDQLRRRRPEPRADIDELTAQRAALSFEEELLGNGEHGALAPALARLEPELAVVMVATVIDGLTTKETARLLGIPQGTVKTRAARARARLQELLR